MRENHMTDPEKLIEKYYHSMGELLIDQGDLEEGIVYFQKAIDVGDTPYAWYGLARALEMAEDTAGAVGAISRAIKLAPGIPEYYYKRSRLLRVLGRDDLADEEVKKAVTIDNNYRRIDAINWAAGILNETFEGVFQKPSCPVTSCPAYCCHFKDRMFLHGVTIGAWKLKALREYFREKGLNERDFLGTFPVTGIGNTENLFSPHEIMKCNGTTSVFFPHRKEDTLGAHLARDIPKGRDYRSLMWIDDTAKPCCFFKNGRCSIWAAGGEPSLDSCSAFLCMTGFIFMILQHLGMFNEKWLVGASIAHLNHVAVEVLIILAGDVYGREEFRASDPPDDNLKKKLIDQAGRKISQLFDLRPA
ncbi:MAG: hypothetical protein H6Q52_1571 [Deltaproteobacteria bacterium]|nr:hypothetical protein [Deltaproteobacteria bacterium]